MRVCGTTLALALVTGCSASPREEPLTVFAAGSLARPLKAALDSFVIETGATYSLETAGSLELARRVTELGRMPDVIALADEEVFTKLLMPTPIDWYARFARNRVVLAVSPRSAAGQRLTRDNWAQQIATSELAIGRSDPDLDPAGYRALME
jgi:molybdate/tungstate transport system substrate-binding protein